MILPCCRSEKSTAVMSPVNAVPADDGSTRVQWAPASREWQSTAFEPPTQISEPVAARARNTGSGVAMESALTFTSSQVNPASSDRRKPPEDVIIQRGDACCMRDGEVCRATLGACIAAAAAGTGSLALATLKSTALRPCNGNGRAWFCASSSEARVPGAFVTGAGADRWASTTVAGAFVPRPVVERDAIPPPEPEIAPGETRDAGGEGRQTPPAVAPASDADFDCGNMLGNCFRASTRLSSCIFSSLCVTVSGAADVCAEIVGICAEVEIGSRGTTAAANCFSFPGCVCRYCNTPNEVTTKTPTATTPQRRACMVNQPARVGRAETPTLTASVAGRASAMTSRQSLQSER